MRQTLEITTENVARVWQLLGDTALYYGDNGGDPDGNAWLPSAWVDATDPGVAEVLAEGLGEMVEALWLNDEELASYLGIKDVLALAQECDDWEAIQNAIEAGVVGWAHYGAYGAADSTWVVQRKPNVKIHKLVNPERCEDCGGFATQQIVVDNLDHYYCESCLALAPLPERLVAREVRRQRLEALAADDL